MSQQPVIQIKHPASNLWGTYRLDLETEQAEFLGFEPPFPPSGTSFPTPEERWAADTRERLRLRTSPGSVTEPLDTVSRGVIYFGGGAGRTRPRKENTMNLIDQVALDVIDVIGAEGGEFARDPGQVLLALAEATGREYKSVSLAVLYLERMEMVEVDRYDAPEAHRANRLVRIRLI